MHRKLEGEVSRLREALASIALGCRDRSTSDGAKLVDIHRTAVAALADRPTHHCAGQSGGEHHATH
jgi:hypothetical protein